MSNIYQKRFHARNRLNRVFMDHVLKLQMYYQLNHSKFGAAEIAECWWCFNDMCDLYLDYDRSLAVIMQTPAMWKAVKSNFGALLTNLES